MDSGPKFEEIPQGNPGYRVHDNTQTDNPKTQLSSVVQITFLYVKYIF